MDDLLRYEVSILIGPCSQADAEKAMHAARDAAEAVVAGTGTSLNYWDETYEKPGLPVSGVEVI